MSKKKPKLIFLWTYLQWGGAQIYFLAIIKQAMTDWDVLVVLPKRSSSDLISFFDQLGVRYEFLDSALDTKPADSLRRKIERQVRRIKAEIGAYRFLKRCDLKTSVVHIEAVPWQSWLLLTALSLSGANVFVTLHNYLEGGNPFRRLIWKTRTQFVSRLRGFNVFTSNRDTKERFRGWFAEAFHEKIEITYTAIDPEQIMQATNVDVTALRQRFSVPSDHFVVLSVGQFIDRKGRWVFLDAAKRASQIHGDFSFIWVMPQPLNSEDQGRIDTYELGSRFVPVLSSSVGSDRLDVLRFFKIGDIFALPSFVEGLPIALLEAMALGISSISTNVFAIPEAIKNEETGLLIEAGDSQGLADAFLRLRSDAALRRSLSKEGREWVLEHFDERESARIAIRAYERALAK